MNFKNSPIREMNSTVVNITPKTSVGNLLGWRCWMDRSYFRVWGGQDSPWLFGVDHAHDIGSSNRLPL